MGEAGARETALSRPEGSWGGAALTAAVVAMLSWTPLGDRDWPWHLADFGRMWSEGRLPWKDEFSYASKGDFVPVHWLFELALGWAHRLLGFDGIALLRSGLVVLAFVSLQRLLVRRGLGSLASSALSLTAAAAVATRLIERPHLVTLLGIVLLWAILLAYRDRGSRKIVAIVPLFAVWANCHPGVVHGTILAAGFALVELARVPLARRFPALRAMPAARARRLALWVGLGILATLATPYGPRLYPYLFAHVGLQRELNIQELRALDFTRLQDFVFVALFLVGGAIMIRGKRGGVKTDLTELGATAGFVVLTATAAREAMLALVCLAVTLAPVLAATIREARDELEDKDRGLHVFAWAFALVLGFGLPAGVLALELARGNFGGGLEAGAYCEREAEWILREKPEGPLYNTNGSGGYLIWRLDPVKNKGWRVYSDGRQPLFFEALRVPFLEVEARWEPKLLVFDYDHLPWIGDMKQPIRDRYALVHFSDGGRTYVRREGPNARFMAQAYAHVFFSTPDRPGPDHPLEIHIDSEDPAAARKEILAGVLAEEPGGYWGNLALARAEQALGAKARALEAVKRALLVKPHRLEARELCEALEGQR
jgi:hypothetical protein